MIGKIGGGCAGEKVTVGIVTVRQVHNRCSHAGIFQAFGELPGDLLASLVFIFIEGDVDHAIGNLAKLVEMGGGEMGAHSGGRMAKTGLPQHGQVEQAFDENQRGEMTNRVPGEQTALGAREEAMRKSRADTAAVEVDDLALLTAGKHHTSTEGITALRVDETMMQQFIERVTLGSEVAA
jgi:hypothetical protein